MTHLTSFNWLLRQHLLIGLDSNFPYFESCFLANCSTSLEPRATKERYCFVVCWLANFFIFLETRVPKDWNYCLVVFWLAIFFIFSKTRVTKDWHYCFISCWLANFFVLLANCFTFSETRLTNDWYRFLFHKELQIL